MKPTCQDCELFDSCIEAYGINNIEPCDVFMKKEDEECYSNSLILPDLFGYLYY